MKKFIIILLAIPVIIITVLVIYRYQIIQYSAESIIKRLLPDYVKVDKIAIEFIENRFILKNFRILNPPGFSDKNLLEIETITCNYKMKGKNILDGVEIIEPMLRGFTLNVERLRDGRLNLNEMKSYLDKGQKDGPEAEPGEVKRQAAPANVIGNRTIADIIKLPEVFFLRKGDIVFKDWMTGKTPNLITFNKISADLSLNLSPSYTAVNHLSCKGKGELNGKPDELIKWDISWDPATPKLTMSNRFEVSGFDILTFEPYYDKYSPFVFKKGRFSGTLIFDFDNGSIGSTNEVHLWDFVFYIKKGYENAAFWETSVPDLVKYFSSSFGDIVFDFKIKGDMENPQFYLGPISKQAITSMAIDKISSAIEAASSKTGGAGSVGPKSDIEKAKEYIDLFRGLTKQ